MSKSDKLYILGLITIFGGMALVFSILASLRIYELLAGTLLLIPVGIGGFLLMEALFVNDSNEIPSNRSEK